MTTSNDIQTGKCPNCGSEEHFDYTDAMECEDDGYRQHWHCNACGKNGREIGLTVFTGHVIECDDPKKDDDLLYEATNDTIFLSVPFLREDHKPAFAEPI
jgi:hypothetical protein